MSKQVQSSFFDLRLKSVDSVAKAGSNIGGVAAGASWHGGLTSPNTLGASHDR